MTRPRLSLAAALLGLALGGETALAAESNVPPAAEESSRRSVLEDSSDPSRYPPSSVRLPLVLGGLAFSATAFGATAASAAGWPDAPGASKLYIPVAGPWLALAENRCPADGSSCDAMVYVRGILEVLSGLAQIGGLAVAAEGVLATTEAGEPEAAARWRVSPLVSGTLAGLSIRGDF